MIVGDSYTLDVPTSRLDLKERLNLSDMKMNLDRSGRMEADLPTNAAPNAGFLLCAKYERSELGRGQTYRPL
jgi:hypothetical protein